MQIRILAIAACAGAMWSGTARADAPQKKQQKLSMEQCVALALRHNHEVLQASDELDASEAARGSARGAMLPRLRADASVQRWDEPLIQSFGAGAPPFTIREQITSSVTLSVVQPLTSLWSAYELYNVRDAGVDVARVQREIRYRDTAYLVGEAFYRLLQAQRLAEVSKASVEQLEGQAKRAGSFYKQGLVGKNDLLRAELALGSAQQRLIQTRGQVTIAAGRLALLIGLSPDTEIEPVGAPTEVPKHLEPPLGAVEDKARDRLETKEIAARTDQARAGVRAAWSRALPQVNLVGQYQRTDGQVFTPPNAWFIGGVLTWDIWDWGQTYFGAKEARAQLNKAQRGDDKLADSLRLEARTALVMYQTAYQGLMVAKRAVEQAEENFRIENRRYEANSNTTVDVVEAEALLTQSRAQVETALYDYLIARANLGRATGADPLLGRRP